MTKIFSAFTAFIMTLMPIASHAAGEPGDGYASSWQLGLQQAGSPLKAQMDSFHNMLLVIITVITLFVLALILWVVFKYRRKKNPNPADFAHHTMIEVLWTLIPVIILFVIAIPSFNLLFLEDRIPEPEMTIKATGYQWYWGYEYTDYQDMAFLSYMIPENEINEAEGQRRLLSTDEVVVLPTDTNIQLLVTAADVLHSFAMPSLGVKRDAVPGRLNEAWIRIDRPGTYFGQCSEICGTGHAYMPIEIRAVPRAEFDAWVAEKGGSLIPAEADEATGEQADTAENMLDNENVSEENIPEGAVEQNAAPDENVEQVKDDAVAEDQQDTATDNQDNSQDDSTVEDDTQ